MCDEEERFGTFVELLYLQESLEQLYDDCYKKL